MVGDEGTVNGWESDVSLALFEDTMLGFPPESRISQEADWISMDLERFQRWRHSNWPLRTATVRVQNG